MHQTSHLDSRATIGGAAIDQGNARPAARAAAERLYAERRRREALQGPVLGDSRAVMDYLFAAMAHEPVEQLRVLYLNTRNCLLFDETVVEGSINIAPIYPREIVRRSLEVGATALILAHNHPSGDPRPSREDIRVTRLVAAAADALDIRLHDHVIVARSGWTSLRAAGYL